MIEVVNGTSIFIYSLTLRPEQDTPAALQAYAACTASPIRTGCS